MPVKRRVAKARTELHPHVEDYFFDELTAEGGGEADEIGWSIYMLDFDLPSMTWGCRGSDLWRIHGDDVVRSWIAEHPGTRPRCWWRWAAPEELRTSYPYAAPPPASQRALLAAHGLLVAEDGR